MTERYNAGRTPHRIRTRAVPTPSLQWEVFQTLLGFAFTVQQEAQRVSQQPLTKFAIDESLASGVHPALQRIAACARNLTESSGAAVALGDGNAMVCVARSGDTAPVVGAQFDAFSGLSGECIRTGEAVICVNAAADPRVNYQACRAMDIASMLYLPLYSSRGKLMGMLGVFASQPLHFSKRDLTCLQFTEALVQEALNRSASGPEPDALAGILRRAEELDAKAKPTSNELEDLITEYNLQAKLPDTVIAQASSAPVETTALEIKAQEREMPVVAKQPAPKVEPVLVGRIVDESAKDSPEPEPYQPPRASRLPLLVAGVVTVLVAIGGLNYQKIASLFKPQTATAVPTATQTEETPKPKPTPAMPPVTTPPVSLTSDLSISSNADSAIVTVMLAQPVTYDGGALPNPDRVYVDLRGLKLTDASRTNFEIASGLVSRIRVAGYSAVSTRIVFDLRHPATYKIALQENPKRLVITLQTSQSPAATTAAPRTTAEKVTVVIDPGHGGRDTGTIGPDGLYEKDVTLDVAKRLGLLLRDRLGATVVFTRIDDSSVPLNSRVSTANQANADFLISIHGNSSSFDNIHGVETYYFQSSQEALATAGDSGHPKPAASSDPGNAKAFAADVQTALLHGLAEDKQPMRDRGIRHGSFVVLREARMPAVLAEISFMSTRKDAKRLESALYREQVASALYQGIARHVSRRASPTTVANLDSGRRVGTP